MSNNYGHAVPELPNNIASSHGYIYATYKEFDMTQHPGDITTPLRFQLWREQDDSTLKHIADAVRWTDDSVSVHWLGEHPSTVFWNSLADAAVIHRGDGKTQFIFIDPWVNPSWTKQ